MFAPFVFDKHNELKKKPSSSSTMVELLPSDGVGVRVPALPKKVPHTSVPTNQPNKDHVHVVPLDDLIRDTQDVLSSLNHGHTRGTDEHPSNPKHHLTHWGMIKSPVLVINHLWDVFRRSGAYVVWNYTEFYNHFAHWTGSYTGLLTNVQFVWRAFVTLLLTICAVEVLPLIEGLGRLLWDIFYVIRSAFGLVERFADELFMFLTVVWDDTAALIGRFF